MIKKRLKKEIILVLLIIISTVHVTFSQSIKGFVLGEDKLPLEFASVAILQPKDSLLVKIYFNWTGR